MEGDGVVSHPIRTSLPPMDPPLLPVRDSARIHAFINVAYSSQDC